MYNPLKYCTQNPNIFPSQFCPFNINTPRIHPDHVFAKLKLLTVLFSISVSRSEHHPALYPSVFNLQHPTFQVLLFSWWIKVLFNMFKAPQWGTSLYRSPNIVRVIKSRRLRWAGNVARKEDWRALKI